METLRKVAWKKAIPHGQVFNPQLGRFEEPIKFFNVSKGLWPQPGFYERDVEAVKNIARESTELLAEIQEQPEDETNTSAFWRRELENAVQGGRILQCDKNLGVKFVTSEYYRRLAKKAFNEYEVRMEMSPEEHKKYVFWMLEEYKKQLNILVGRVSTLHVEAEKHHAKTNQLLSEKQLDELARRRPDEAMMKRNMQSHVQKPLYITFLRQLREFLEYWWQQPTESYSLPKYQLLLKVHKKPEKDGLLPTRPIVPTWGLPNYHMAKWLGAFMAKMARQIPWALESTEQFTTWLDDSKRSSNVATYDFTNLYGNEPVTATLHIFARALEEMSFTFDDEMDKAAFEGLMTLTEVPPGLEHDGVQSPARLMTIMLMMCVAETACEIDVDNEDWRLAGTHRFLAMGVAPVAPLSIITLAYLEQSSLGRERCTLGMRRLIDDIVVDHNVISEQELRSVYPRYLTLNVSDRDHFLDVSFHWNGQHFTRYPYIKEHAVIPLSFFTNHPYHTVLATARNELARIVKLCNNDSLVVIWVEFWFRKYRLAEYPESVLQRMIKDFARRTPTQRTTKNRGVNHVETWEGYNTLTATRLSTHFGLKCDVAWKVNKALVRIALRAHVKRTEKTGTE